MRQLLSLFCFIFIYIAQTQTQILYECNFDNATATNHCFTTLITITESAGFLSNAPPNGARSDVTSSLKPTSNGEVCRLPYKVGNYPWDMYFCNNGYCPTASNPNSTCTQGKFGSSLTSSAKSFQLKTTSGGINGVDEQCLTYYYYMPPTFPTTLTVLKQEVDDAIETIDSVTGSPFNGWIQRSASFISNAVGYNISFNLEKPASGQPYIGFDEISIRQGSCDNQPITEGPIPTTTTTTTTAILVQTSGVMPITIEIAVTSVSTPLSTTSTSTQTPVATSMSVQTTSVILSSTGATITATTTTAMETSASSTTTPAVQTSYFDRVTTADETRLPTSTPITSTTTFTTTTSTPSAEMSTVQSSSSTTSTTTISSTTPISIETSTSVVTVPITITTTTTTTSTLISTTTENVDNVVISSYDEFVPREKSHTIIMATIIPILWIAFIVAVVWMRRSTGVLSGLPFPFTNRSGGGEASSSIELNDVSEA